MEPKTQSILTPEFRLSFPNLFVPTKIHPQAQNETFNCKALFPKDSDLSYLEECIELAIEEKWGERPKAKFNYPLRDGEETDHASNASYYIASLKSKFQPQLVDQNKQEIVLERDLYAGCWVRAVIDLYAYDIPGNKGVSFTLIGLQKVRDDEPFTKRTDANDIFGVVEGSADHANFASDDIPF